MRMHLRAQLHAPIGASNERGSTMDGKPMGTILIGLCLDVSVRCLLL